MADTTPRPPMVVTHDGGKKFTATVRSHRIVVDQPARAGGEDAGVMPLELMGVALGTCVALYVQQFCLTREIPHEGMRVEVEQRGAQNPNRIGEFAVRVVLPAEVPEQYAAMLERVARSCPVHNTFEHGAKISLEIAAGAGVA